MYFFIKYFLAELDFEKGNYEKSRQLLTKFWKKNPYNLFYFGKLSEQSHRLDLSHYISWKKLKFIIKNKENLV